MPVVQERAGDESGALLLSIDACHVPDMEADVMAPLRGAGYTDEPIRAVGGVYIERALNNAGA